MCHRRARAFALLRQINGSLFNVFLAIVKENNVENEMSGELPISRLKMGDRKQGNPRGPEGVERGYPCLRSPHF